MKTIKTILRWLFSRRYRIIKYYGKYFIQKQSKLGYWYCIDWDQFPYVTRYSKHGYEHSGQIRFDYETFNHAKADLAFYLSFPNKSHPNVRVGYTWDGIYRPILIRTDRVEWLGKHNTIMLYPLNEPYSLNEIINIDDYEYKSVSDDEKYYEF